jgi:hypothetical protein
MADRPFVNPNLSVDLGTDRLSIVSLTFEDPQMAAVVGALVRERSKTGEMFVPMEIAREFGDVRGALAALEHLFQEGYFASLGYTRTNYVYHAIGTDASSYRLPTSIPAPGNQTPSMQSGSPQDNRSEVVPGPPKAPKV